MHSLIGRLMLRVALAIVFLWFGFSQLLDPLSWVGMVPDWAVAMLHIPPAMIVLSNGLLEVVLGSLLVMGILVRVSAAILGIHLLVIAFEMGLTPIGVRDFGLAVAVLALVLLEWEYVSHRKPKATLEQASK